MSQHHKSTRRMMRLRDEYRTECAKQNAPCWICDLDIDYTAPSDDYTNDDRFQLDHFYPVSTHAELQEDVDNFRPSHAGCNRERSNGEAPASIGIPSQEWT